SADKDFSEDTKFSPKASTTNLSTDSSPDSKCPICLDGFDNVACLDRCLHRFCFCCIQEWSKNKAECPLCKQPFSSIFHTICAEDDFKEYIVNPSENRSFASPDGQRFRYHTTLTGARRAGNSPSRRTLSPAGNGVLFEGLSSEPVQQRGGEIQQMIRRLASRRQASAEGRSLRQIQEEDMINFRRALYRTGVRIRSIEDGGRYRDISAEFFRRNPACLHRLVPWLKRELTVLFGAHESLVNIVQHIIMSNVTRYDLESEAFAEDLKPFLLNRTEHFLHEFISFARGPFNLEAYDQHANYDCPAPSYDEGSHSDSSIITISPDTAYSQGPDNISSPWNHRLSRKRKSRSPRSCSQNSRGSHGHRSRREHRRKSQLKRRRSRSRDSSKHRSKRSSRRSKTHDTRIPPKSQRGSLSRDSTPSRGVSRSRSRSRGHSKRRSRSRDSDRYYARDNHRSRHHWGYAFCSRNAFGDGYESSSRRKIQSNAHYSRQSASPEYRIRSFIERTDVHSQRGVHERHYYCYERCRSRSQSSNRPRTPSAGTDRMKSEKPGGKRKYKSRHLENAFLESSSPERENNPKKTFSKLSDCYRNEDSLSDNRASSETKHKKKKKKMRSPSVEIIYEGKATDTTRHLKKKKKKHKKKHRKHHESNSARYSPVVITIDSDSSKEPESTECDSSIAWTGTTQINERGNEPLSSFPEKAGCGDVYRAGEKTGGAAKKYSIPTRRGDLDGDIRNADVKLRERAADHSPTTGDTSSNTPPTETVTSYVEEAPARPSYELPSPRISFL
ncbi:TOPRS ligase, partial [Corythaeola cristata]|nr:TOPRS ligase [Corythaeola cristata]